MNQQLFYRRTNPNRTSRAFTLIELLVVLVIISILTALISVAVLAALKRAKLLPIETEISGLDQAMELYKLKHGFYPPSNGKDLKSHISAIFPRIDPNGTSALNNVPDTMDASQVLVFCLNGYSSDPRRPVSDRQSGDSSATNGDGSKKYPPAKDAYFTFDTTRIKGSGFNASYLPPEPASDASRAPYIYFCVSRKLSTANTNEKFSYNGIDYVAYYVDNNSDWVDEGFANGARFQILCAGLDGKFGKANSPFTPPSSIPTTDPANIYKFYRCDKTTGPPYKYYFDPAEEADNLSNFYTGTLEDTKP